MNTPRHSGIGLRVAILGAGGIAETHAEVLSSIPGIEAVAICDLQFAKAEAFRDKMGFPAAFSRLETMLSEAQPHVVHLAVSPPAHVATALTCIEAGAHVFVEKPFCLSSEECGRIAAAAARSKAKVGVNHNMVFHPAVTRTLEAVRDDSLGGIEHATIAFNLPTPELPWGPYSHWLFQSSENIVFELGVHPLSVVHRLFGRVLEMQTLCSGEKVLPSGVRFYSHWQISMRCERGTATVLLSLAAGFHDVWLHIQAEDGICHADLRRNTVCLSEKSQALRPNDDLRDALQAGYRIAHDGVRHYKDYILSSLQRKVLYPTQFASINASIRAFYDALLQGVDPPIGLAEGAEVVHACELAVVHFREPKGTSQNVVFHG
jgi:predicted dehydrogenase